MKKLTKIVLLVVVLVMSLVLATACETLENHEHKPAAEWLFDGTSHYHACTFEGCTEKLDVTACAGGTATCTQKATCATCGNQYGQLAEHVFDQEVATADYIKTQANHTDKAVYYKSCVCGEKSTTDTFVYGEVVAHEYQSVVTAPTCTTAGYTTYTCECGHTYTDDEVDALGHNEVTDEAKAPTCTEAGLTAGKHCDVCGEVLVAQETVPATGHNINTQNVCANCGGELTTVVPVAGKGYIFGMTQAKVQNKVFYLKGGMNGYYMETTENPAEALTIYIEETEGGYHAYCYVDGTKTYINMVVSGTHVNGAYEATASTVYTIDAEHHTLIAVVNSEDYWFATRNDKTYTTMGPCKVSFAGFYGEFYDVCVHTWEKGNTTDPTCDAEGYTTYTCANCGKTKQDDKVDALGHDWVKGATTAPTCTEDGYTTYSCACGDTKTGDTVEALGHDYKDGTCSVCGEADPDYVAPTPVSGGSADFDTITTSNTSGGDSGYKNTYTTTNGWTTVACAIQTGGTAVANPAFPVVGADKTSKAVCLTGSTTLPGKVTSPTLTGGISTLTIKYTKMFTDLKLSVTVTVTDLATGTKYTHVIARDVEKDTDKYVVWEDIWTLETQITGDFTIEVVNNSPSANTGNKDRFTILDLVWEGAKEEHVHEYTSTTTATCTTAGTTTYTCACGHTYTEETPAGHIDANLDVSCDREGCTGKVAPKADTVLSCFTANNLGSKLSTSGSYYVVGTIVEVLDAKNGVFLIDDGTGEKFYFRLPKDADGVSHASWTVKLVLGDKVQVYGKVGKFSTTTAPNGQYWPAMQSPVATVLERHPHDFTAVPATCSKPAYCACGQSFGDPLGCADTNGDQLCDDCGKNVNYIYEYVEIRTDNNSGVHDATALTYTWNNDNFTVQVAKATGGNLYTTAKDHMRMYKGNTVLLANKNGLTVKTITVHLTNATQIGYFEKFLTGYTYTTDAENFTITIEINSAEDILLTNPSSNGSTTQIKGFEFGYEKPQA